MRYKKLLVPLLLLFILTPLIVSADTPATPRPSGVIIESHPSLAEVWIDGKFVGSTSLSYRLMPGDHKIEVTRAKYTTWSRTLTVEPDQSTHVAALLQESASPQPCQ